MMRIIALPYQKIDKKANIMKLTTAHRDIIFLLLLIVMVKVALNSKEHAAEHPILYAPGNHEDGSSYEEERRAETENLEAEELADDQADMSVSIDDDNDTDSLAHKPDQHIMAHLNTLLDQLDQMLALVDPVAQETASLKSIQRHLLALKRNYQHTSPAILLLGPIGSAGVVLQEQELEKELLRTAQKLAHIMHNLIDKEQDTTPTETITQAIEHNTTLLSALAAQNKAINS